MKITWKKSVAYWLLISAVSLVLLEGALRAGGALIDSRLGPAPHNPASPGLRVLFLGESTTAWGLNDSYPSMVQKEADKDLGAGQISVINGGVAATDTAKIRGSLRANLDKFRPDIVVLMMGINDPWSLTGAESAFVWRLLKEFRLVKILVWIREAASAAVFSEMGTSLGENEKEKFSASRHPAERVKSPPYPPDIQAELVLMEQLFSEGKLSLAQERWHSLAGLRAAMESPAFWYFGGRLHLSLGQNAVGKKCFERFLQKGETAENLFLVANYYYWSDSDGSRGRAAAKPYLERAYRMDPNFLPIHWLLGNLALSSQEWPVLEKHARAGISLGGNYSDFAILLAKALAQTGRAAEAIEILQWGIAETGGMSRPFLYINLFDLLQKQGQSEEAKKVRARGLKEFPGNSMIQLLSDAAVMDVRDYLRDPRTRENYLGIVDDILNFGAKVVAVQYPTLSGAPLRELLRRRHEVTVVENVDNFQVALSEAGYENIFSDRFAGSFGHTTPKGSLILAQSVWPTIKKLSQK